MIDISSHVPATLVYSERGESVKLRDDSLSCHVGVTMPDLSNIRGGVNIPPSVAPVARSNPFLDLASMDHIMRVVAAGMAGRSLQCSS